MRVNRLLHKDEGKIILKTSEGETRIIEQLLEISEGTLGQSLVKTLERTAECPVCGRHFSLLDVVKRGISVHGKTVIKDIISGTYGYIWNENDLGGITCYQCGNRIKTGTAYWCLFYGCSALV